MENLPRRAGGEIDAIIDRYQSMVYGLALARTGSPADADDVFQETFLAYCQSGKTFRDEEHRKAWLLRTAFPCTYSTSRSCPPGRSQNSSPCARARCGCASPGAGNSSARF